MLRPASSKIAARKAFTLIELLTVIAIIAILAALVLTTAGVVQENSSNSLAKTQIEAVVTALEAYKLDNGSYPAQLAGGDNNSTAILYKNLVTDRINQSPPLKPYMEFPVKMLSNYRSGQTQSGESLAGSYLVDPFGNPYHYQSPGADNRGGTNFFDFWSQGKKNSSDTNKWIKSW